MRISDWSSDVCSSDLSITVDDLEQHTRQPPTDGAHPLLKPDQVLLVAASERIANDCGGGGYPHRMRPDRSPFVPDLFDDELRLADIDAAQLCSAHITVPGSCSDTKPAEASTGEGRVTSAGTDQPA